MEKISISNERREEIKIIVVELFEKYRINCVPISGFEIAMRMGIKVVPYSALNGRIRELVMKESTDGFTGINQGICTIFYNDYMSYGRINNTMMHEIGHVVLGHYEDSELAEAEVKFFAKYALVPPVLVHKLKLTTPKEIEEVFKVSRKASQYAWEYYEKWLNYGERDFTPYEIKTLRLFKEVM